MLAPAMIILAVLTLFPTIYMFTAAFQKISPDPDVPREFVGLANFARMFTDAELWRQRQEHDRIYRLCGRRPSSFSALVSRSCSRSIVRRFNFLKTILMMPMMLPPIAVAITWKLIYQPQFGVLNEIMFDLGLPTQAWAGDVNLAMFSIIVADVWEWTPFIFLLMLAGPGEPAVRAL